MEQILLYMGVMLLFAKLLGSLFERFGIASLVGEVIAGIILGPVLGWVVLGDFFSGFMMLGIIFLMFIAGMEVRLDEIKDNMYKASFLAVAGGLMSFLLGFLVGMVFFNDFLVSVAIGTVILSTSNGALFLLLMKSGKFDTKIGKFIVAVTIADDIVGVLALAFFRMYINSTVSFFSLFFVLLVSLGFYLFILTTGSHVISRVLNRLHMFTDENLLFTMPVAIVFLLSFVTDNLNLSMAAGAFLAGMAISNSHFADHVIGPKVGIMAHGLLLPLFYASVGTLVAFSSLNVVLIVCLIVAAMAGKFIGCGLLSAFIGMKWEDMKLIGMSMMPRGDENIGILQLVMIVGLTTQVYTSIVFALIATTMLAPVLVKMAFRKQSK
jgi:Kef-type K+ transport system membrane component KefB